MMFLTSLDKNVTKVMEIKDSKQKQSILFRVLLLSM